MRNFPSFFILEMKRLSCRRNLIILSIFLLFTVYFVQDGIGDFMHITASKEQFKEIERMKVSQYDYYNQYGKFGFRLLFIPSPLCSLFVNSSPFQEVISHVDSGFELNIYNSFKGRSLFVEKAGGFKDLSGIILLFGSMLFLGLGYDSFIRKEYLRFISSFSSFRVIFWGILITRLLMVIFFSFLVVGAAFLVMLLNRLPLVAGDYGYMFAFFGVTVLLLDTFLLLGMAAATIKSRYAAIPTIIILWFGLVFMLPGAVAKITAKKADNITSGYKLEFEKLRTMLGFEKRAIEKEGKFIISKSKSRSEKELMEDYWQNEFRTIQQLENSMEAEMKWNIRFYQTLSLFSPSTFYTATGNEIGSRGYDSMIAFYKYVRELKDEFIRFYIDKTFSPQTGPVESFVRDEENVFYARSRLPRYFGFGLALNGLYIVILIMVCYFKFRRSLFNLGQGNEWPIPVEELRIKLEIGKCTVCITSSASLRASIYRFFVLAIPEAMIVELDGLEIKGGEQNFVYLCHPEFFPVDIRTIDLVMFFKRSLALSGIEIQEVGQKLESTFKSLGNKRFYELSDVEKGNLLFTAARLKKSRIYLIDEIERGMPQDFTNGLMENLRKLKKEREAAILYLSSNLYFTAKVSDKMVIPPGERIENILK